MIRSLGGDPPMKLELVVGGLNARSTERFSSPRAQENGPQKHGFDRLRGEILLSMAPVLLLLKQLEQ